MSTALSSMSSVHCKWKFNLLLQISCVRSICPGREGGGEWLKLTRCPILEPMLWKPVGIFLLWCCRVFVLVLLGLCPTCLFDKENDKIQIESDVATSLRGISHLAFCLLYRPTFYFSSWTTRVVKHVKNLKVIYYRKRPKLAESIL